MRFYKLIFIIFLSVFMFQGISFADKIYLKSGKILDGKVMERRKNYNPARSYCDDPNAVVVWENGTYHCIAQDDIQKVDKEYKKPQGLALLVKPDKWGTLQNGYATQLIAQSNEYVVGKPMKFGLVLMNKSDSLKWYDHQAITHNTLIIKTPDNNEPYYKVSSFQTAGSEHPIDKGEIVTLFEDRNISDEYVILKPGKYKIQFHGGIYGMAIDSNFPASNIVEFVVKPASPNPTDLLISSILNILPDSRWQTAASRSYNPPSGRKEVKGISIILIRYPESGLIMGTIIVTLWQTQAKADVLEQGTNKQVSDYLGMNSSGYFYIEIPPKALDYWPNLKEDIIKNLKLKS